MEIYSTIKETKDCLTTLAKEGKTIGFVPTMGALHAGHISLLKRADRENNVSVASIFVNPLQFNDKKDHKNYPRTINADIEKLKSVRCDVLFIPSVEEMYGKHPESISVAIGKNIEFHLNLGILDKVMEAKYRPGHFRGVCHVVKNMFDIIGPDKAYFGEKDFQQLAVIKCMVKTLNLSVKIIPCFTVREVDGLAMSSRNILLTSDERKNAGHIYKTLCEAKGKMESRTLRTSFHHFLIDLKKWVEEKITENPFLKLEYFEIVNSETFLSVQSLDEVKNHSQRGMTFRACIAVKVGKVRLIDNIPL